MRSEMRDPIDAIRHLPGVRVHVEELPPAGHDAPNALVSVVSGIGESHYAAWTKAAITTTTLPSTLTQLERHRPGLARAPLLLSSYLTPAVTQRLLDEGIEFADGAGNMYLDGSAAYVLMLNRKPRHAPAMRGFTQADLKVIYALLAHPALRKSTVRALNSVTGVSLGKISGTVNKLVAADYLRRSPSGALLLREPMRLLERWDVGYLEQLRPKLSPSRWRLGKPMRLGEVANAARQLDGVLVGGEFAADALIGQLQPATLTLHVTPTTAKATAHRLRLRPADSAEDVVIINRFAPPLDTWDGPVQRELGPGARLAHAILVRAELLSMGDGRLREIAERLLDNVIAARIRDEVA